MFVGHVFLVCIRVCVTRTQSRPLFPFWGLGSLRSPFKPTKGFPPLLRWVSVIGFKDLQDLPGLVEFVSGGCGLTGFPSLSPIAVIKAVLGFGVQGLGWV